MGTRRRIETGPGSHGVGWEIRYADAARPLMLCPTERDATELAAMIAEDEGAELVLRRDDGSISATTRFFGRPRGRTPRTN